MPTTIQEIMEKIPQVLSRQSESGLDAVVHFKFTGSEAGEWNAVLHDGTCEVAQGLPRTRPTISIVADSSEFLRVATGDIDPAKALMTGTVRVAGDVVLAERLVRMLMAG